jgi:anti-sigma-K factor RskA
VNYLLPERLDRLAREYALGTLVGPARRRFERVLQQSPAAALAVGVWQERLAGLAQSVAPLQPRSAVWAALEQRLFAVGSSVPVRRTEPLGWFARLFSARSLGGALAGVVLCVLVLRSQPGLIGMEPQLDALPQSYVGLLLDSSGKASLLASSRRQGRLLTVKLLQPIVIPAGRVAQLWALPKDGSAAFPVGVVLGSVSGNVSSTISLPDTSEKLFSNVARLAVSLEPAAAKPGDQPSAEFVLSGHCVKLW